MFLRKTKFHDKHLTSRLRKFFSTHIPNDKNNKTYIYNLPNVLPQSRCEKTEIRNREVF